MDTDILIKRLDKLVQDSNAWFLTAGHPARYTLVRLIPQPDGSTRKMPIDLRSGNAMRWRKDPYFVDFTTALTAYKRAVAAGHDDYRIGVLLGGDDWLQPATGQTGHLLAIDLDHVPDLVEALRTGSDIPTDTPQGQVLKIALSDKINPWYCEVSQSGQGLHLLAVGDKHDETLIRTTSPAFEYYDSDRWITLTGEFFGRPIGYSTPDQIKQIEAIISKGRKPASEPAKPVQAVQTASTDPALPGKIQATIDRALHGKGKTEFAKLFAGESPSGDASSDDMSFVNRVYYYSGGDVTVTDGVVRRSKRMRPKWDEVHSSQGLTYGQMTIKAAAESAKEVCDLSEPASFDALCRTLRDVYWATKNALDGDKKIKPDLTIRLLKKHVHFARLWTAKPTETMLYYWNPDTGIWSKDETKIDTLITAVNPEMTSPATRQGVRETLRVDFELPVAPVYRNPRHWIAVENGLLSLDDYRLWSYSPYIYVTQKLATPYVDKPSKPVFDGWDVDKWLTGFADGDRGKLTLIWETIAAEVRGADWLGACVVFVDGDDVEGGTGKSTLELMIRDIIGADNTQAVKLSDFDDDQKLLTLIDCPHVIGFDSNANDVISKFDRFKASIVNDPQQLRPLYSPPVEWDGHYFMIQSLNGQLQFDHADQAVWDRVKVIKFRTKYRGRDDNKAIQSRYIKSKALHEYVLYKALHVQLGDSLTETDESKQAVADLAKSSDSIAAFVTDSEYLGSLQSTVVPSAYMYQLYRVYCAATAQRPEKQRVFGQKLKKLKSFTTHWTGTTPKRLTSDSFRYGDTKYLLTLAKGCGARVTFLPTTRMTAQDEDGPTKTSYAEDIITEDTFDDYLASGTKQCYVLVQPYASTHLGTTLMPLEIDHIETRKRLDAMSDEDKDKMIDEIKDKISNK